VYGIGCTMSATGGPKLRSGRTLNAQDSPCFVASAVAAARLRTPSFS
jgi:hypothetical protein